MYLIELETAAVFFGYFWFVLSFSVFLSVVYYATFTVVFYFPEIMIERLCLCLLVMLFLVFSCFASKSFSKGVKQRNHEKVHSFQILISFALGSQILSTVFFAINGIIKGSFAHQLFAQFGIPYILVLVVNITLSIALFFVVIHVCSLYKRFMDEAIARGDIYCQRA